MKKLTLSNIKCHRLHIGEKVGLCPELKIHEDKMNESSQEKYLGDMINTTGNIKATVADRISRGHGIVSEIRAILNEVPLGRYKLEMGLHLRQAMLLNGLLFNSEAWHSVTQQDIISFEKLDENLLRCLLGAHSKTPLEMLYLESGATPIRFVLASRRLNYLQTIIKREDEELTKRVLQAQIESPLPGDFIKLVEEDSNRLGVPLDLSFVENSSIIFYKKFVKTNVKAAALKYLKALQQPHTKVNHIKYDELSTQKYLTSPLFDNNETELLFALRTRTVKDFKANFPNMNIGNMNCPLNCWTEGEQPNSDTQQHILQCSELKSKVETSDLARGQVEYNHLFSDVHKQKEATVLFDTLITAREQIMNNPDPPGAILDPSTSSSSCCGDLVFTPSVLTVLPSGK